MEYRAVALQGIYDYGHAVLVGPKSFEGTHGFHLIVPFFVDGGPPILVNKGFVSSRLQTSALGTVPPASSVSLHGLIRSKPRKHWSSPQNRPAENAWHWIDVDAISRTAGIDDLEKILFVEEVFDGDRAELQSRLAQGVPIGRERAVQLRNTHATYAFIW